MLTVNMQCSSVDLLERLATHVQHCFAWVNSGSTNTIKVAFHVLLLLYKQK